MRQILESAAAAEAAARTHIEHAARASFQMLFDLDEAE